MDPYSLNPNVLTDRKVTKAEHHRLTAMATVVLILAVVVAGIYWIRSIPQDTETSQFVDPNASLRLKVANNLSGSGTITTKAELDRISKTLTTTKTQTTPEERADVARLIQNI